VRLSPIELASLNRKDRSVPYVIHRSNLIRLHLTTVMNKDTFEGYYTVPVTQQKERSFTGSRGQEVMTQWSSYPSLLNTGRTTIAGTQYIPHTARNVSDEGEDDGL